MPNILQFSDEMGYISFMDTSSIVDEKDISFNVSICENDGEGAVRTLFRQSDSLI